MQGRLRAASAADDLTDLGNALSTVAPGGALNDLGDLTLSLYQPIATPGSPLGTTIALGTIPASGTNGYAADPTWYARTAGVVAIPVTAAQRLAIAVSQLALSGTKQGVLISESSSTAFVRADRFVFRLSPGNQVEVPIYAMQFGRPMSGATISVKADASQLQPTSGAPYVENGPPVATPASALSFAELVTTDSSGRASLLIKGSDPGTPRYFNNGADYGIDGQVYGVRPAFADTQRYAGPTNQWNFVSVLLWSAFTPKTPVTWSELQPIFQQYANLYPVMNRFLNLADYDSVVANAELLLLAFGLDPTNPNAMPVTRDLSPAKRDAILTWLKNPIAGKAPQAGKKVEKAQPPVAPVAAVAAPPKGGKAAAAARRLVVQQSEGGYTP